MATSPTPRATAGPGQAARGLLAGLALLTLGGCANGGASPMGELLTGLWPGAGQDPAERAGALPYASLALDTGDRRGLVVLGAAAGASTYWPTANQGLLVLHQDGLQATAGLPEDLLHSHYRPLPPADAAEADFVPWRQAVPEAYRLERRWQDREGLPRQLAARGELRCEHREEVALPLGPRTLERCEERLAWENGRETRSTLWRDAESHRLWAVQTRPWPGGPRIEWQVARAWWQ